MRVNSFIKNLSSEREVTGKHAFFGENAGQE